MRVLIVDDERSYADLLATRLALRGAQTLTAYDGAQAERAFQAEDFDVAILDLNLPDISGLDLLRSLKDLRPHAEAIMLTASDDVRSAVEGMRRGAFTYLVKPAEVDDLLREMTHALERRRRLEESARMIETGKFAALGRMAEGVAHEINNPVNVLANEAGWMEDLLADVADGADGADWADGAPQAPGLDELAKSIEVIRAQTRRVKAVTAKLLIFGKGLDPRPRECSPLELARETMDALAQRAEDAGARMVLDGSAPGAADLRVLASPVELKQTLLHVMENALDAMAGEAGGAEKRLVVRIAPEAIEGAKGAAPRPVARIDFEDEGHGVPPEVMPHVYEPFFSTKEVGQGMGLGLSVVWGVITGLGGTVEAHSPPPGKTRGALFTLRIPTI